MKVMTRHLRVAAWGVALVALSATSGRAGDDPAPAPGGQLDQLSVTLPEGWVMWDPHAAGPAPGLDGVVVLSPRSVQDAMTAGVDEAVSAQAYSGEVPLIYLERAEARHGASCRKIPIRAMAGIELVIARDPSVSSGNLPYKGAVLPREKVEIGGCQGVRFVLEVHKKDPARHRVVDARVVSDGRTLYVFRLRNSGTYYAKNREVLDGIVSSVRFLDAK